MARFKHHRQLPKDEARPRSKRRHSKITERFIIHPTSMLDSEAFAVLSLSALRVLFRLEIEHSSHGGTSNGRLVATYDDFEKYGVHRQAIAPAIRELVALGFIRVTERGRAGNREFRAPNKFLLTFLPTWDDAPMPNDWKRIKTKEQAEMTAKAARELVKRPRPKKRNFSGGIRTATGTETTTENPVSPVVETTTTGKVRNPPLLSIYPLYPQPSDDAACCRHNGNGAAGLAALTLRRPPITSNGNIIVSPAVVSGCGVVR
jgi:hypothetical protein